MKNKHRIMLALLASLGLVTFGVKNANAKSNVPASNSQALVQQAKSLTSKVNKASDDINHLPSNVNLNQIKQFKREIMSLGQNLQNQDDSKQPDQAVAHKQTDAQHLHVEGHKNGMQIAKHHDHFDHHDHHGHFGHLHHHLDHLHHDHNGMRHHHGDKHSMMKHHFAVHLDKNRQNVDGMNHFTSTRNHYLYNKVGGNTRDLGGYPADNNKYRIASDRIIRSADLDGLSQTGLNTLKQLHVNKVIDLRYYTGKDGIQGHPDPSELRSQTLEGSGIDYQLAPVYTHTEAQHLSHYMKAHGERGEYYYYGNLSVSEPQAIKTYRKVFSDLLNNKHGAILFHCNLGRDRTGVTSALILSALGVNRNLIYHDYLLTYRYHYHFSANKPNYSMHAAELEYFFKTIDTKYGSVKAYLTNKIGLNRTKILKLRKMYLVPKK